MFKVCFRGDGLEGAEEDFKKRLDRKGDNVEEEAGDREEEADAEEDDGDQEDAKGDFDDKHKSAGKGPVKEFEEARVFVIVGGLFGDFEEVLKALVLFGRQVKCPARSLHGDFDDDFFHSLVCYDVMMAY
jgi:hypothetical protein